jgi:DNA modification methylase
MHGIRSSQRGDDAQRPADSLRVESWPIDNLTPYQNNPRVVSQSAIDKGAQSITAFGWRQPIVVDTAGVVIVGHTRLLAAKRLGLSEVPVHVAEGLSPERAKAYRLADNRSAQETEWDTELLGLELKDLGELGLELDLTGFESDELAAYLGSDAAGLTDPDFVPEPPAEPITKPGDLWILGNHRLLAGDATKAADVARLMGSQRAVLMATDPPYLVDYTGGNHPAAHVNPKTGKRDKDWEQILAKKDRHWDDYVDHATSVAFYVGFLRCAKEHALAENAVFYQWFAAMRSEVVFAAWREAGLLAHMMLIWHKSRAVLTHVDYLLDYEPMLYGWVRGSRPPLQRRPPASARCVWEVASGGDDISGVHPTQKPVELIRRCIEYHTRRGELVYEPFAGSGTTIVAAQMTDRCCFALEISPAFCDVAIRRFEAFSGKRAVLHSRAVSA